MLLFMHPGIVARHKPHMNHEKRYKFSHENLFMCACLTACPTACLTAWVHVYIGIYKFIHVILAKSWAHFANFTETDQNANKVDSEMKRTDRYAFWDNTRSGLEFSAHLNRQTLTHSLTHFLTQSVAHHYSCTQNTIPTHIYYIKFHYQTLFKNMQISWKFLCLHFSLSLSCTIN